jgi:hypothetical protein
MRLPSQKAIRERLIDPLWQERAGAGTPRSGRLAEVVQVGPERWAARIVREALEFGRDGGEIQDYPNLAAYVRAHADALPGAAFSGGIFGPMPWFTLDVVDHLLDGHGVEQLNPTDGTEPVAYVNLGDTYDTTVLYDYEKGRFYLTDWGTIVEEDFSRFEEP